MKKYLVVISILFVGLSMSSQSDLTFEYQIYPTGSIPGLTYDYALGLKSSITLRLAANIFDHRDLGVHDGEEGSGFGGSIGYKKYFSESRHRWFWHARTDLWFNDVTWFDEVGGSQSMSRVEGETSIIVLQPTLGVGYAINLGSDFILSPSLSYGLEWNIQTEGEPTGEGPIILAGIQIGKRL